MKKSFVWLMFGLSFGVVATARSQTVGWWRFDDYGDVHKTEAGDSFANHVERDKYPMLPRTFVNLSKIETDVEYMPSVTNSFGRWAAKSGLKIYDPVSGKTHEVANALRTTWGGNGSGLSGGAIIKDDPELRKGSFTWECIFKPDREGLARSSSMSPLLGQRSASYEGCWSLILRSNSNSSDSNYLWCRCKVKDENGTVQSSKSSYDSVGQYVAPDKWHHAAISFDSGTGTFAIYLDYTLVNSFSYGFKSTVAPGEGEDIYVAKGRYNDDRSFLGEIAEVRCSDEALDPEKFLQFDELHPFDRATDDPDVVFWHSLDGESSFDSFMSQNASMFNVPFHRGQTLCAYVDTSAARIPVSYTNETAAAAVRPSLYAGPASANNGSMLFSGRIDGSAVMQTDFIKVNDSMVTISTNDFTEEFFFKANSAPPSGKYYALMKSMYCKVLVSASGTMLVRPHFTTGDQDIQINGKNFADGKYHHFAFVYDKANRKVTPYVDYVEYASGEGDLKGNVEDTTPHMVGMSIDGSNVQILDGEIDEFRITRRKLSPEEFLSVGAYYDSPDSDTLFHIGFNGDFSVWPCLGNVLSLSPYSYGAPANVITNVVRRPNVVAVNSAGPELVYPNLGSSWTFGGGWYLDLNCADIVKEDHTVEFFYKMGECHAPWATVIGFSENGNNYAEVNATDAPWAVGHRGTWDLSQLTLTFNTVDEEGNSHNCQNLDFGAVSAVPDSTDKRYLQGSAGNASQWTPCTPDGRWHHVAVTFEKVMIDLVENTRATVYYDYKQVLSSTQVGHLYCPPTTKLCGRGGGWCGRAAEFFTDEVRVSKGVLSPSQFIRQKNDANGMLLIIR